MRADFIIGQCPFSGLLRPSMCSWLVEVESFLRILSEQLKYSLLIGLFPRVIICEGLQSCSCTGNRIRFKNGCFLFEIKMSSNNSTGLDLTPENLYEMFRENHYDVIGLYAVIFLAALIANILVIIVVFKDNLMRSATNYFLVNLAVADLLVTLVCMPSTAWRAYTVAYYFGEFACIISTYIQCVSVASSILTITTMATDRYVAIIQPFGFHYRRVKKSATVFIIIVIWLVSLVLFLPILWISQLGYQTLPTTFDNITICMCQEIWTNFAISRKSLGIIWFVFMFAVPGLIMLFTYSVMGKTLCSVMPAFENDQSTYTRQGKRVIRERKRVACILLLLAVVFATCWLPYHIMNLIDDTKSLDDSRNIPYEVRMYALLLGHSNSVLNPLIYCALSRKFRNSIMEMFACGTETKVKKLATGQESSGSAIQLRHNRLKSVPAIPRQLNFATSRLHSSQKTTKTCAV